MVLDTPRNAPDEADLLLDVALQFGSTLDLERLATLVVERLVQALEAERAAFVLLDRGGAIERAFTRGFDWGGLPAPLPLSRGVIAQALQRRELVVVGADMPGYDADGHPSIQTLELQFVFAMPVLVGAEVAGVLYVDSKVEGLRGIDTKGRALEALSRLVATAVENARMFEDLAFRNALLAHLAHEFRGGLTILETNADLLVRDAEASSADPGPALDIAGTAGRMSEMIESTLTLARTEAGAEASEPVRVDVAGAVRAQADALASLARSHDLRVEVVAAPDLPRALVFRDRLRSVLGNLLMNALKFATPGSAVRVRVGLRDDAGPADARARRPGSMASLFRRAPVIAATPPWLEVAVHNRGTPVPPALLPVLFDPWTRAEAGRPGLSSTGLGLAIVDQCVRSMGGAVWARSSAEEGTTVTFTLTAARGG